MKAKDTQSVQKYVQQLAGKQLRKVEVFSQDKLKLCFTDSSNANQLIYPIIGMGMGFWNLE